MRNIIIQFISLVCLIILTSCVVDKQTDNNKNTLSTDLDKSRNDDILVSRYVDEWSAFRDIASYPTPGEHPCEVKTMKGIGNSINISTLNEKECEKWIKDSEKVGKNGPMFLEKHPGLIAKLKEHDFERASEVCKYKGKKLGIYSNKISTSSNEWDGDTMMPGDGRYHCIERVASEYRTFYSFTSPDGKLLENEDVYNNWSNKKYQNIAKEKYKSHPYMAEIDCGGFPLSMCFGIGNRTMLGQIEVISGEDYNLYSGNDFLSPELSAQNLTLPLRSKFYLNITNGSSQNKVTVRVYNTLTMKKIYERSAGPYRSMTLNNL